MKLIKIKYPIWATRSVGIADYKINDNLLIEILYENKDGERLWPEKFYISQSAAKRYPVQVFKGTRLHIIPIRDLIVAGPGEKRVEAIVESMRRMERKVLYIEKSKYHKLRLILMAQNLTVSEWFRQEVDKVINS